MMRTLLKKDWRVYRAAVVGAAVLTVGPYVVMLLVEVLFPPGGRPSANVFMEGMEAGAGLGLGLTLLMAGVFGGMAFAAERRDRSAEFLAMLPVRRSSIALSKVIVPLICLTITTAVHAIVVFAMLRRESEIRMVPIEFVMRGVLQGLAVGICVFVLFFGLAWMLSLNLSSPAIAATAAIGAGVILLFLTMTWAEEAKRVSGDLMGTPVANHLDAIAIAILSLVVGMGAFVGSTVHYVRRVQP